MERVWREAPMAALRIVYGAAGLTVEPNTAALCWGADAGVTAAHWQALGERLAQALPSDPAEHCVVIGPQAVTLQARRVALDDGALVWLRPSDPAGAEPARRRMERALDLAGVTVWRIELATQRVYFDTIGIPLQGLVVTPQGLPLAEFRHYVHPDDLGAIEQAAQAALAGDRIVDAEARYLVAPDEWRQLLTRRVAVRDADGRASALIGIAIDVSQRHAERVQAEALAEQARMVEIGRAHV